LKEVTCICESNITLTAKFMQVCAWDKITINSSVRREICQITK